MEKNRERVVNVNSKANAAPPIKFTKAANGRPTTNNFKMTPKNFQHLTEYITSVRWDSVKKMLHIEIYETPKFEVMKWLNFMDEQFHQYQKSPFLDLDTNVMLLNFLDANDKKVASLRFKNLKVENHGCRLDKEPSALYVADNFMRHTVTISYQYTEMRVHADRTDEDEDALKEETRDKEWQTVELPA